MNGSEPLPVSTRQVSGGNPIAADLVGRLGMRPTEVKPLVEQERLDQLAVTAYNDIAACRAPSGERYRAALAESAVTAAKSGTADALVELRSGADRRLALWEAYESAADQQTRRLDEVKRRARVAALERRAVVVAEIEATAVEGWKGRDDEGDAWVARKRAEDALPEWRWLSAVFSWGNGDRWQAGGADPLPSRRTDGATGARAGGYLAMLQAFLDKAVPIIVNNGLLDYPADAGFLFQRDISRDSAPLAAQLARAGARRI